MYPYYIHLYIIDIYSLYKGYKLYIRNNACLDMTNI